MIFRWLYDTVLHLMIPLTLPNFIYQRMRYQKYQHSFPRRCGFRYPLIEKKDRFLIWVHAVSVGETKAVSSLIKQLKTSQDNICVVISNVTETGHTEAKKSIPEADYHVYLPFDLPYIVRPIISDACPDLVLLSETDFWFHFQDSAKKAGARLALVNGKLSEKSMKRYGFLPWLTSPLFKDFDLFCVQSELHKRRFMEIGVSPGQIVVTGNLKLDDAQAELSAAEKQQLRESLGLNQKDPVLVIGSTHDPEEKWILDALRVVWKKHPRLKVIIAPRHPERFSKVKELLEKEGVSFVRYSESEKGKPLKKVRLLLLDAMGVLKNCYQIADLAIVAGSFTNKVGGHNLLEPSRYGVPVIYGPHVFSQRDLAELLQRYEAGVQVPPQELAKTIINLFNSNKKRLAMGEAGRKVFYESQGATQHTYTALEKVVNFAK